MSTEPKQSTGRVAQSTTSGGNALTACGAINSTDRWVDLEAQVFELWEATSESIAQVAYSPTLPGVSSSFRGKMRTCRRSKKASGTSSKRSPPTSTRGAIR
jgi:hypothetical protein